MSTTRIDNQLSSYSSMNKTPNNIHLDIKDTSPYLFRTEPLEIDANIEEVWSVIKNIENYNKLSEGAITAHVNGAIEIGKKIELDLYKNKLVGKFIPHSSETITMVDNDKKVIGWQRELPGSNSHTERYHFLEKIGENKTLSSIVLHIPGIIGLITNNLIHGMTVDAFNSLNAGIKKESEMICQNRRITEVCKSRSIDNPEYYINKIKRLDWIISCCDIQLESDFKYNLMSSSQYKLINSELFAAETLKKVFLGDLSPDNLDDYKAPLNTGFLRELFTELKPGLPERLDEDEDLSSGESPLYLF